MDRFFEILRTVLPVILVLAIGVLCRSKKLLSREGINALKRVVVDITLPAVLVNSFATMEYSARSVLIPLVLYNGRPGKYRMKWFFYIFYPAHMVALYLLSMVL